MAGVQGSFQTPGGPGAVSDAVGSGGKAPDGKPQTAFEGAMNAQRQVAGEPMAYGPDNPPSITGGGGLPGIPGLSKLPGLGDLF